MRYLKDLNYDNPKIALTMLKRWGALITLASLLFFPSMVSGQNPVINSVLPASPSHAPGDTIIFEGTDIFGSSCNSLVFSLTTPPNTVYTFFDASFTITQPLLDQLAFGIPLGMPCGIYDVVFNKDTCGSILPSGSVQVTISDAIGFTYSDSIYCLGESNPLAMLSTTHTIPPVYSTSLGGNILNPVNGEVFLTNFAIGTHEIYATTAGTACNAIDTVVVTVKDNLPNFTISYPDDSACGDITGGTNGAMAPVPPVPDTFGTFSSVPNTLQWVNQDSGIIDLLNSPSGVYTITYLSNPDSCYLPTTTIFEVLEIQAPEFSYDSFYCRLSGSAVPLISNLPPSYGFATLGTPPGLTVNAQTGVVDLNNPNLGIGTFSIVGAAFPSPTNVCPGRDTASFDIAEPPNAAFNYPTDTFCQAAQTAIPSVADPNGLFVDTNSVAPDLIITGPALGIIDISTSSTGGPFTIFHYVDDGFCQDTAQAQLFILNPDSAELAYQDSIYCQNDSNPSPVFVSGLLGGHFYSDPPLDTLAGPNRALDPVTGTIYLSHCPADTYQVYYSLSIDTCESVFLVGDSVRIDSFYNLDFMIPDTMCEDTTNIPIQFIGGSTVTNGLDNYGFTVYLGQSPQPGIVITPNDSIDTHVLGPGSSYQVVLDYQEGICSDTVSHYITLLERFDPSFEYLDSLFCQNGDDPVPFIIGTGGGYFYDTSSAIPGITVATNGEIDLGASEPGLYNIFYNVGTPACPSIGVDTVRVFSSNQARFFYDNPETCKDRDTIFATLDDPSAAGVGSFSSSDSINCPVNIDSGYVVLDSCQPGTYQITHTLASSICLAEFKTQITISQHDTSASLNYADSTYCPSDTFALPTLTFDSSGFFPGIAGLVFSDTAGGINLQQSQPGLYEIIFKVEGICPLDLVDTIRIIPYTDPSFFYGFLPDSVQTFYCTTDDDPTAITSTAPGTFFTFTNQRDTVPWINPNDGTFLLDSVVTNSVSPFTICHTPNAACTFTYCDQIIVNLGPSDAFLTLFPKDTICAGDSLSLRINGGDSHQWISNGSIVDQTTLDNPLVYIPDRDSLFDGIVISVLVGDNQNCNATIDTNIVVNPVPSAEFVTVPTIVSSNSEVDLTVRDPLVDNVTFDWTTSSIGAVTFFPSMDEAGPALVGQEAGINSLINLDDDRSPAQIIFTVTPRTDECIGLGVSDTILVNPLDQPIFVPEVFTPNSDGVNDTWQIQWRQDFDLSSYTMLVFNRAGAQVYRMSPVTPDWSGDNLPDGVYWWKLLNQNGRRVLSGGVTIRRK